MLPQVMQDFTAPHGIGALLFQQHDDGQAQGQLLTLDGEEETVPSSCQPSRITIRYVTEGAANVIFALVPENISPDASDTRPDPTEKRLLRLRKGTASPAATIFGKKPPPFISSAAVHDHFVSSIIPLFQPSQLVQQRYIRTSQRVIQKCNALLDSLETGGIRPPKRRGWHIQHDECSGILVDSMYPDSPDTVLFQFKPKWLAQSPTAPRGARRCRTCALHAQRGHHPSHAVCPLALASGDEAVVRAQIQRLALEELLIKPPDLSDPAATRLHEAPAPSESSRQSPEESEVKQLVPMLTRIFLPTGEAHALLQRLHDLQCSLDRKGILALFQAAPSSPAEAAPPRAPATTDSDLQDLAMAMSLRDTTMFVRLPSRLPASTGEADADGGPFAPGAVQVKLADLDPKSADDAGKVRQWWETETRLVSGGWYLGTEPVGDGLERFSGCLLWR